MCPLNIQRDLARPAHLPGIIWIKGCQAIGCQNIENWIREAEGRIEAPMQRGLESGHGRGFS